MLTHPAIADALTFAIPDARLGEDVAVAAVLKPGAKVDELELRQFSAARLSSNKIPRCVIFLDHIPTGSTGKAQRIDLAEKLGIHAEYSPQNGHGDFVPPRSPIEIALAEIWAQVLGTRQPISAATNFMDLGGDSLQAVAMLAELNRVLGRELPVATLLAAPTIAALARLLEVKNAAIPQLTVVPIQPRGKRTPLFCLPGMRGNVFNFYPLARSLDEEQPLYGVQLPEADASDPSTRSIVKLATAFIQEIRAIQPHGPYHLAGYSFGGYIAFEMAQHLLRAGEKTALVALLNTQGPHYPRRRIRAIRVAARFVRGSGGGRIIHLPKTLRQMRRLTIPTQAAPSDQSTDGDAQAIEAILSYKAVDYPGRVVLFRAMESGGWLQNVLFNAKIGWEHVAKNMEVRPIPGSHPTILSAANSPALANALAPYLCD